jgi:hypothetical protein
MYAYDKPLLENRLWDILKSQQPLAAETLTQKAEALSKQENVFYLTFSAIPRITGKAVLHISSEEEAAIGQLRRGFSLNGYTLDRLARVWWLLQCPLADEEVYVKAMEQLFMNAEMQELVALYGALPLLAYSECWRNRTSEGIRTNIRPVLEAISLQNPYPAEMLEEPAWNQLVLKAFFNDLEVRLIQGLDKRANAALARMLADFARERWAAGRRVSTQLWRLVSPFLNDSSLPLMEKLLAFPEKQDQLAAVLALEPHPAYNTLVPDCLRQEKQQLDLGWHNLPEKVPFSTSNT